MKTYRAVFCDIDGTLIDTRHRLSPATARKVKAINDAGTPFVLISARSPSSIFPIQDEIGIRAPIVCYGGALVLDKDRRPVHGLGLEADVVVEIKRYVADAWPRVTTTVYSHDNWIVDDAGHPRVVREEEITGAVPTQADAREALAGAEAHKVFCMGDPDVIIELEKDLAPRYPHLAVIKSYPTFLEVMNGAVTKARAVGYLCQAMRIEPGDAVAFGDNYNDISMLEAVGLGIAMGNAPEEVRRRADRVTADNDHEGVLRALETLSFQAMNNSVRFERAGFRQ